MLPPGSNSYVESQRMRPPPSPATTSACDAVRAPGPAPIAQPAHVDLGPSPLRLFAVMLLAVGPVGLLLLVAAAMSGPGGAVLAIALFIPWLIIAGLVGVGFLKTLFGDDMVNYKRTRAAVREERIGVSYFIRGWLGDNLVVVDETRRLLCIDGEIIGFDAVRKLQHHSIGGVDKLEIVLASGANPVRSLDLSSETRLKAAFERLTNTLGFSS